MKNGTKVLSKHGVIMHWSICIKEGHNKTGHAKYIESIQEMQLEAEQNEAAPQYVEEFDDPSYLQNII